MVGFSKKTMRDVPLRYKTVLVRADYNVPLRDDGTIADDFRIRASLPTLRALLRDSCKIVIVSHLGRPDGKVDQRYSLEPVAQRLAELLGREVRFVSECIGPRARMAIKRAPKVGIVMLENLRFHPEEEANDLAFAEQLAHDSGAQYFIQDGFGVVHRAHASTAAITTFLPSVAGLLLEREVATIQGAMHQPKRPLVALLGGAKVSDKIQVIEKLVAVADQLIIGGAMANTFLAAQGKQLGTSKVEPDQGAVIGDIYAAVRQKVGERFVDNFLVLPSDVVVAASSDDTETQVVSVDAIPDTVMALDIGPASQHRMTEAIKRAQTVLWNGTLGYAEKPAFAAGSEAAARALTDHSDTVSIIGGGDTADFVINWDKDRGESFSHVSTGGGASLDLIAGKKLPGVEALLDA